MAKTERQHGYYWIKLIGCDWEIAEYREKWGFERCGFSGFEQDEDCEEIDETPITRNKTVTISKKYFNPLTLKGRGRIEINKIINHGKVRPGSLNRDRAIKVHHTRI